MRKLWIQNRKLKLYEKGYGGEATIRHKITVTAHNSIYIFHCQIIGDCECKHKRRKAVASGRISTKGYQRQKTYK
jgi:hypothetical protein